MTIREGAVSDIAAMHRVRLSVRENVLTRPERVTPEHYRKLIEGSFVCEVAQVIVGFCIVDAARRNVWALFVDPEYEGRGIGRQLLERGISWLGPGTVWLTTAPGSRAERFYSAAGWRRVGIEPSGEIRFER